MSSNGQLIKEKYLLNRILCSNYDPFCLFETAVNIGLFIAGHWRVQHCSILRHSCYTKTTLTV